MRQFVICALVGVVSQVDMCEAKLGRNSFSLVQLGLEEQPFQVDAIRKAAKAKFMTLMHDAEDKAAHDPKVLRSTQALHDSEAKFKADSSKASELLKSIKTRLADGKTKVAEQRAAAAIEDKKIRDFTVQENAKLEATEKEFMKLQQQTITSSFAQLPKTVEASFAQLVRGHDGSKAQQEIHTAEKALSDLGSKIKKRVESMTQMLNSPGHQFPGEIVL